MYTLWENGYAGYFRKGYEVGRDLHNDENGRITPSVWMNLTEHEDTVLEYKLTGFAAQIKFSKKTDSCGSIM